MYYTVATLKARWKVSLSQVYTLIRRGDLRAVRIGGAIRIRECDVLAYEERQTVGVKSARKVTRPTGDVDARYERALRALGV